MIDRLTEALADRYRIERELGAGGMATVYLAHDLRHNRRVALKVMHPVVAEAMGADRFLKEIEVTAGLQHPNIVPLFDSGRVDDLPWFVMPYIEGESLRSRLRRQGALPPDEATRILEQVADALAYAHERGIIHRDIKPDNVMLSGRHAFVADFGVARALSLVADITAVTTSGAPIGTPSYMAPEQVRADPDMDHRVDLYALGATGYEMLTGAPPFAGGNAQQQMVAHLRVDPAPLAERRPGLPPDLSALIDRCLRKRAEDRPASAREVADLLQDQHSGSGQRVAAPASRRWRGVAAAALVGLGLLAGVLLWRRNAAPTVGEAGAGALAIFPFTVRGSADLQYLGEGMVNLLTTTLDGAGGTRTVDPRALLANLHREGMTVVAPADAARLAADMGASRFVLGDVVEAGGRLRIDASLYDAADFRQPAARGDATGLPSAALELVDSVAAELLAGDATVGGERTSSLMQVTTASLPALRAYLEGEHEFRAGRYREATEAFTRATAADSGFALAWFRQSIAAEWALQPELTNLASREAVRHVARLNEHDRMMLEALLAFRQGNVERAEGMFEGVLAIWPHDVDALQQLGEIRFHWGPLLGHGLSPSRPAFERILAVEPDQPTALVHLARVAAAEADTAGIATLVPRFMALNPGGERALELQGLAAILSPDPRAWPVHLARARTASDLALPQGYIGPAIWTDEFTKLAQLGAEAQRAGRSAPLRALGAVQAAYLATLQGRWEAGQAFLLAGESIDPALILEHRALLSLMPFVATPSDTLRALARRLAVTPAAPTGHVDLQSGYFDIHDLVRPLLFSYLRGRIAARLGDPAEARRMAAAIRAASVPTGRERWREQLARGVELEEATVTGAAGGMLGRLDPLGAFSDYESSMFSPFYALTAERYARARLLEDAGRTEEALAAYASFEHFNLFDRVYAAPANLRAGSLLENLGRAREAEACYRRVLVLYGDPDPPLRELRRQAEAGLARLAAEGAR